MCTPKWATVLGSVLGASSLDPTIVTLASPGVKLTSLLFATETDCNLVGDSDGQVSVYRLKNLTVGEATQRDSSLCSTSYPA
ncbi:dynein axonemal intermediate chain 4-like [Oncorhynchus keta]|uniref:dynein axonemal intermediate chain 4-like n=1 Tax=Oncorhynchus keta TaxID=8018 RepID=UPI00227AA6E5|nr:dynein axonemal intermediate chain 4-like [Oncorhynchus keta]